jgi:hypothetical protein
MSVNCRTCLAAALVAVLIVGCGQPVPPPPIVQKAPGPDVVSVPATPETAATIPAQPTVEVVTPPVEAAKPEGVGSRLAKIEAMLKAAAESPLFSGPTSEVSAGHRLGPGPNPPAATGGTGGGQATTTVPNPGTAPIPQVPAGGDYKVMAVADGGTIAGSISFEGKARAPKVIKVEKTPEVCGKEDRELFEVTVTDGKLKDVVILLEGVKAGKPFDNHVILGPPPGTRAAASGGANEYFPGTDIKPQKCIFGAFTGVIAQSSVLRFDNLDPVKHSPHTYGVKGRVRKSLHNQDLEGNGKLELPIALKKGYKVVKLECDQHPHMQNWFRLVDNPYYAFSAADGTFSIDQVPPGTYNMIAWHPILGEQEQEVKVSAKGAVDVTFQFSSKRRR